MDLPPSYDECGYTADQSSVDSSFSFPPPPVLE